MKKTQLMLVSAQAAPNLLAALDPAMKPNQAVLLVTQSMTQRADALEAVLREVGIGVSRITLPQEQDVAAIQNTLLDHADTWENQEVMVNLTGGTKLMALAVQGVAQVAHWASFYVDADTDHLYWIDRERKPQALGEQLRLRHYLMGYGYTMTGANQTAVDSAVMELAQELVQHVSRFENSLGVLNYICQPHDGDHQNNRDLTVSLTPAQRGDDNLIFLLNKFDKLGKLTLRNHGEQIRFNSPEDRDFVNGGWFEYWAYQVLRDMASRLSVKDHAMNVEVVNRVSGQNNELDVAFLARNRLFVMECKTAKMSKANDVLYTLAGKCSNIGGLGTRGLLVSYRQVRPSDRRLADSLKLKVVAGKDLLRLRELLLQWVNPHN